MRASHRGPCRRTSTSVGFSAGSRPRRWSRRTGRLRLGAEPRGPLGGKRRSRTRPARSCPASRRRLDHRSRVHDPRRNPPALRRKRPRYRHRGKRQPSRGRHCHGMGTRWRQGCRGRSIHRQRNYGNKPAHRTQPQTHHGDGLLGCRICPLPTRIGLHRANRRPLPVGIRDRRALRTRQCRRCIARRRGAPCRQSTCHPQRLTKLPHMTVRESLWAAKCESRRY